MHLIYEEFYHPEFGPDGTLLGARFTYPENFNYAYDIADVLGRETPDALAMLWRDDQGQEVDLTFGRIKTMSDQAANVLAQAGLDRGDVLMVSMRSFWEFWVIALAAHKLGVILAPVYHRLTAGEVIQRMTLSGAKGVICIREEATLSAVSQAAEACRVPLRFTVRGDAPGFSDFSALMAAAPTTWTRRETLASDPMLLYFTSGTTGTPKGVLHDFAAPLSHIPSALYMQHGGPGMLQFATGDTGWEVVCGSKFYGQWACGTCLFVYDYARFLPQQALALMSRDKVTSIMVQPTVYRKFTDVGMDRYDLSAMVNYGVGGEKLTPDLAQLVYRQTGHVLYEGYAQSEAGLIAANSQRLGRKEGSIGRPLPKYHVELLGEDGQFVPPGQPGEIVLLAEAGGKKPVGLLMGYYRDPEATANLWDGSYFHTGDLAWRDEEGYLFYLGRADGVIKTKGYRVSPFEIEEKLSQHPAVYECLVAGIPDRDLGQRVTAFVRLGQGVSPSRDLARELMAFHNAACAGYKKIRNVTFVRELPRNANGKLLRPKFPADGAKWEELLTQD